MCIHWMHPLAVGVDIVFSTGTKQLRMLSIRFHIYLDLLLAFASRAHPGYGHQDCMQGIRVGVKCSIA